MEPSYVYPLLPVGAKESYEIMLLATEYFDALGLTIFLLKFSTNIYLTNFIFYSVPFILGKTSVFTVFVLKNLPCSYN